MRPLAGAPAEVPRRQGRVQTTSYESVKVPVGTVEGECDEVLSDQVPGIAAIDLEGDRDGAPVDDADTLPEEARAAAYRAEVVGVDDPTEDGVLAPLRSSERQELVAAVEVDRAIGAGKRFL